MVTSNLWKLVMPVTKPWVFWKDGFVGKYNIYQSLFFRLKLSVSVTVIFESNTCDNSDKWFEVSWFGFDKSILRLPASTIVS